MSSKAMNQRSLPVSETGYEPASRKLAQAAADVTKWSKLAASPNLSPEAALWPVHSVLDCTPSK
jgi:hypothetical protein